jgi:hypothetical protein
MNTKTRAQMGARVNTLHGAGLAMTLRKLSEQATERIWIVSPYIGRWPAVSALLGGTWWLGSTVTLQVITDVSDAGNVHRGTLLHLLNRGLVKTLAGVHAKIYIIDDQAIVASANLTETGFTKRREIAVLLGGPEATDTISLFKTWWETLAQELTPESIEQLEIEKPSDFSPEREGAGLPVLWPLPPKPDGALFEAPGGAEGGFASYQRFLKHYNEFAAAYAGVQRLWPDAPLFLETDAFLNYLFHEAEGKPSFEFYSKREPRCPAGNVRNATAATAANPAAQASIAEYPNLAIAAPPASEATNCAANATSIIRAAAPVRSCSRTRSISSVFTPGSVIHWQDV